MVLILFFPFTSNQISDQNLQASALESKTINIFGKTFTINYSINGGDLHHIKFNHALPALDLEVQSDNGGSILLTMPRSLLDSRDTYNADSPFIVTVNGQQTGHENETHSTYARTINISFGSGVSTIEIIGTVGVTPTISTSLPESITKITDPSPLPKDLFGWSVAATSKNNIIVGTPNGMSGQVRGGIIYVYDETGRKILSIADPGQNPGDQFGLFVTSFGNDILVGAPYGMVNGTEAGVVYLFDDAGKLLTILRDPTPHTNDQFGEAIATMGSDIIVGSPYAQSNVTSSGEVYLFDATTGRIVLSIPSPDSQAGDMFGVAVTSFGNKIVVGAPHYSFDGIQYVGATYVFSSNGILISTLLNPDPDNWGGDWNNGPDAFGTSLASGDNIIVVGEPGGDVKGHVDGRNEIIQDHAGMIRVYDGTSKTLLMTLQNPHPVDNDDFGISVALGQDKILVGVDRDDTGEFDAGTAYLYDMNGSLLQIIHNPSPSLLPDHTMGNRMGTSVAFSQDALILGAPGDNTGAEHAGSIYIIKKISDEPLSPHKQVDLGIFPSLVVCKQGFVSLQKAEDGTMACVSPQGKEILIHRGWGSNTTSNRCIDCMIHTLPFNTD